MRVYELKQFTKEPMIFVDYYSKELSAELIQQYVDVDGDVVESFLDSDFVNEYNIVSFYIHPSIEDCLVVQLEVDFDDEILYDIYEFFGVTGVE